MSGAFLYADLCGFLQLEQEAEIQAAIDAALSPEEFRAKNKAELAEIEASIRARFDAMSERED